MATLCTYGQRLSLFLVLLTLSYVIGIFIFTQGFLLNRLVVPKYSSCNDQNNGFQNFSSLFLQERNIGSCWMPARFKRAVIIVIDALRHDFMLYNESMADQDANSYQNKLKVIQEVLTTKPDHGKVFKFVADPPTTTMQRIKGLTTGSLPTFIDAGSNFASSEILEDNIISQLKSHGKKLVFIGDDTWMALFPNSFQRSYPFPSFNVKDLHTVDNGVISHLVPEIQRNDWDIIIAHFLGVDHCGHRYGPYHTAMAEKLTQMNEVLRSVMNELDSETLLLVFGDHGMTKTGDHGGDSEDEIYAGLFAYSSTKPFATSQPNEDLVVSQTDIVPTLSLLLGVPIPFANLGIVITSLFNDNPELQETAKKPVFHLQAIQLNARQVHRYVKEYSKLSNDISSSVMNDLTKLYLEAEDHVSLHSENNKLGENSENHKNIAEEKYLAYLQEVREVCRSVWARFDLVAITAGLVVVCGSCLASILIIFAPRSLFDVHVESSALTRWNVFSLLVFVILVALLQIYEFTWTFLAICLPFGIFYSFIKFHRIFLNLLKRSLTLKSFTMTLVLTLYFLAFFSNSFVVHEDKVVLFFLQTILLISSIDILKSSSISSEFDNQKGTSRTQRKKEGKKPTISAMIFREIKLKLLFVVLLIALTRLGQLFWFCREEQSFCQSSSFVKPSEGLAANQTQPGYHFWISSALICLVPVLLLLRLKSLGNLNGYSCTVLSTKYALPLGALFACVHWLLQFVPAKMINQTPVIGFLQQIVTPCVVYFCSVLTLLCLLYKPLTIYFVDFRDEPAVSTGHRPAADAVVEIFKRLRSEMGEQHSVKDEKLPIVYGLGTVYSSAISILVVCFSIPIALLLGDSLASSVTLMLLHIFAFLELNRTLIFKETVAYETTGSLVYAVVTWFLMSSHYFFSSGHQATIPSIRFEAAFVGLPGDMQSHYLQGFLILLNTFASDVIFTISLPLIMFWSKKASHEKKIANTNDSNKGEFVYGENPEKLRYEAFQVCALYQVCKGLNLLATMSAAAVHRRHLMVWKIFAPRFIFEGVSFIITSMMLILVFWFILRVDNALRDWQFVVASADKNKHDKLDGHGETRGRIMH